MHNELEIQRDIPLLYARIQRCREACIGFERAILEEERAAMSLKLLMAEDETRAANGLRPRYVAVSMRANIDRHGQNILMFRESIAKEEAMAIRTQEMIAVLEADATRPTELVADLRQSAPSLRHRD